MQYEIKTPRGAFLVSVGTHEVINSVKETR